MKNVLINYTSVINEFNLLMIRFERENNLVNSYTIDFIQFIIISPRWVEVFQNAKIEISDLYMSGSPIIKTKVGSDFEKIGNWIEDVRTTNKFYKSFDDRITPMQNTKTGESENTLKFLSLAEEKFSQIEGQFLSFFNPLLQIIEYNKAQYLSNADPAIFINDRSFSMFDKWVSLRPKKGFNDYIVFCYKQMVADNFAIQAKDAVFKEFMQKHYQISIDKIKTLTQTGNPTRHSAYALLMDGFKSS